MIIRRTAAFLIDLVILHLIGAMFGNLFPKYFATLGSFGYLAGLGIILLYFYGFEAHSPFQATPGKIIFRLKVRRYSGHGINLSKSLLRTLVVFCPWILAEYLDFEGHGLLVDSLFVILRISLIFLLLIYPLFYKGSMLQDLVSDSTVGKVTDANVQEKRIIPSPYIYAGLLVVSVSILITQRIRVERNEASCKNYKLSEAANSLSSIPSVLEKNVRCGNPDILDYSGSVTLYTEVNVSDSNLVTKRLINDIILGLYGRGLRLRPVDKMYVWCYSGYDIGIYSQKTSEWKMIHSDEFNSKLVGFR